MQLYKITSLDGEPIHGGSGKWALPKGARPGKWMSAIANVRACLNGYHLIPAKAIVDWLPRKPQEGLLWEAEGRGDNDKDGEKTAFAQARLVRCVGLLDEKSMRLAAADIAERVLPIFYKVRPNDKRPAEAIQAARDSANGKFGAAARAAAWAAAWAAAGDAAGDAAWVAARAAAGDAAWVAAGDAAGVAAWAAAGAAAWAAAGAAAWAAAGDAAGVAAGVAAGDAAGAAARDAAGAAAWAAAGAAARAAAGAANAKIILVQAAARLGEVS